MTPSDPIDDLAPFLEARRRVAPSDEPPEYLTARLISSRATTFAPPLSPIPEDELPREFGPYLLKRILGHGATGTVYAAHDPELTRDIAVKILSPDLAGLADARERFLREARAAASLQHDHLMPVFAVHQDTPFPCLTMPLLEGETLEAKLRREGPIPPDDLVILARQITSALQHAHQNQILHRDLKPSNIFYETTSQRAILMDFGLARTLDAPSQLTLSGTIAGTPEFLAPEQIDDDPNLTPATDFYALGATLYTLASGKPPFSGLSLTGLLKKVATHPPEPLPQLPAWIDKLILSLLAKAPKARPASAEVILKALEQKKAPRKSTFLPKALLAVLIAAIGVVVIDLLSTPPRPQAAALHPFSLAEAIASDQAKIIIPEPGIYHLDPINLSRDLTISAAHPDTIIQFTSSEVAISTWNQLTFENLTLRYEFPGDIPTQHFITTSGPQLNFINCRLEQPGLESTNLLQPSFINATAGTTLNIENSAVFVFRSPLFQGNARSKITIQNSIILAPALSISRGSGETLLEMDHTTVASLSLTVSTPARKPSHIRANHCHLETNRSFLWAPGASAQNLLRAVRWQGDHNTFSTQRGWLSTSSSRRPSANSLSGDLDDFASWQEFWNSDPESREVEMTIIRNKPTDTKKTPAELQLPDLKIPYETGPDLENVGPR
ncbi:serine/threonine-protein kinase [Verrucomicrobiaceae bacterium 227]